MALFGSSWKIRAVKRHLSRRWWVWLLVAVFTPFEFAAVIAAWTILMRVTDSGSVNLGAGALLAAIIGGPLVIWSTVIKAETLRYQKEGHITDRISKSVEHLGAEKTVKKTVSQEADGKMVEKTVETTEPNIEVRIGGLLSLERIAQDSTTFDNGRDHVRIMEILCVYIRENTKNVDVKATPWTEIPGQEWGEIYVWEYQALAHITDSVERQVKAAEETNKTFNVEYLREMLGWISEQDKPRQDIQLALHIIGRRSPEQRRYKARWEAVSRMTNGFSTRLCQSCPSHQMTVSILKEQLRLSGRNLRPGTTNLTAMAAIASTCVAAS